MNKKTLLLIAVISISLISQVTAVRGATFTVDAPQAASQNLSFSKAVYNTLSLSGNSLFVPQDCQQGPLNGNQGSSVCQSTLSDGQVVTAELHYEKAWQEYKEQTILTTQDGAKSIKGQSVVRHKIEYTSDDQTKKLKESFDIVRYPQADKTSREFVIFQYGPDGKSIQRVYHSTYRQIADTAEAALIHHTVLTYDEHGYPLKGRSETWKDGKKSMELFRWDRRVQGTETFDSELWKQWEGMALKASQLQTLVA